MNPSEEAHLKQEIQRLREQLHYIEERHTAALENVRSRITEIESKISGAETEIAPRSVAPKPILPEKRPAPAATPPPIPSNSPAKRASPALPSPHLPLLFPSNPKALSSWISGKSGSSVSGSSSCLRGWSSLGITHTKTGSGRCQTECGLPRFSPVLSALWKREDALLRKKI